MVRAGFATPAAAAARGLQTRSRLALVLWLLLAVFIVYGSLVPFDMVWTWAGAAAKLAGLCLNPFLASDGERRASLSDVAQNLTLFAPFGLLGALALGRQRVLVRVMWVTALGALLSATVETLQLFTIDRVTSVGDLFFDTLGACAGALSAGIVGGAIGRWLVWMKTSKAGQAPALYPVVIAASVLCVAAWQPFDITVEAGAIWGKVKALGRDPWQMNGLSDEGLELLRYLLFAASVSVWFRQAGVGAARTRALAAGVVAAFGLEASQFFFESRMPGLEDALVHSAGALAGVAVVSSGRAVSPKTWLLLLLAATWGGAALQALNPLTSAPAHAGLMWRPLSAYRGHTPLEGLSHCIDVGLPYIPVGFALVLTVPTLSTVWIRAMVVALVLSLPLVWLEGSIGGHAADLSDVAVAILGCVAGAWVCGVGFVKFRRWLASVDLAGR